MRGLDNTKSSRVKILIVDDEPLVLDVLTASLGDVFDVEVERAETGLAGAKMIAAARYDLAIIDAGLPQISGLELAELAADRNIPVLLISGHPQAADDLQQFGFPYLAKPFPLDRFISEVTETMRDFSENIRSVKEASKKMMSSFEASEFATDNAWPEAEEIDVTEVVKALERTRRGYRKQLPILKYGEKTAQPAVNSNIEELEPPARHWGTSNPERSRFSDWRALTLA